MIDEDCEAVLIIAKLSKAGYGSLKDLMESDAEMIMTALDMEKFTDDFEEAFMKLNALEKK